MKTHEGIVVTEALEPFELALIAEGGKDKPNPLVDSFRHYIENDAGSELFAGEKCSRVFAAKEGDMSSAYLMSFTPGYEQRTHNHTGGRILFIVTKSGAFVLLGSNPGALKEVKFKDNSCYMLRMDNGVYHRFGGDFVALSIHPQDTKVDARMEDETNFPLLSADRDA